MLTDVNNILQIRISYEEKHGVDDEIILSYHENKRVRPPRRCDIYLLTSNTLKQVGVSWEARAESSIVSQVSVIADLDKLESIIKCVIKSIYLVMIYRCYSIEVLTKILFRRVHYYSINS